MRSRRINSVGRDFHCSGRARNTVFHFNFRCIQLDSNLREDAHGPVILAPRIKHIVVESWMGLGQSFMTYDSSSTVQTSLEVDQFAPSNSKHIPTLADI